MRWRRPSGWRCSRTSPGSASITARSPATSASAWSTPSRNSRSRAAASRPACSIRRNAACSPTPPGASRKASAGRSQTDPGTGVRLGLPTKLVPQQASDANGTKWTSPTGTIQIQLARRKEANPATAKLAEREKKEPGRTIDYSVVKPDFFVLSGLQGLKKFYMRGTFRGDEVRILTILYDQATENTVEPVVIAMSSAFTAFPAASAGGGAAAAQDAWNTAPASSSARTAPSSPTARSPTAASRSRSRASAMPIASPRTRRMTSRCCASMARAG